MWSFVFTVSLIFTACAQTENVYGDDIPAPKQKLNIISNKIDNIAKDIISRSSSANREYVMKNVEEKLLKAAEHLGEKGKSHVKLIMEGIKFKVYNYVAKEGDILMFDHSSKLKNNFSSLNDDLSNDQIIYNLSDKIELLFRNELAKLKTPQEEIYKHDIKRRVLRLVQDRLNEVLGINNNVIKNETRRMTQTNMDYDLSVKNLIPNSDLNNVNIESTKSFKKFTIAPVCDNVYDRACSDVKKMNSLKCLYDDVFISLEKLCDGQIDCADRSDEKYCGSQAMERMQFSNQVIGNIETYLQNNCFAIEDMQSVFSKQTFVLRDVLLSHIAFTEKYRNFSQTHSLLDRKDSESESVIKGQANEIATIISSLALALDSALCSRRTEDVQRRANIFDVDLDKMFKEIIWPPKCNCKRELHCLNCSDICKRICWHKYSLTMWQCESINGTGTVPLNSLCDGKLDCYDESDERNCGAATGYAKFEVREMYSKLIKMLNLKASKERPFIKNNLNSLINLIQELQKMTAKSVLQTEPIRKVRNKCYSLLKDIYSDILKHSSANDDIEEEYVFLSAVNKNLGVALKRSHTGNKRIIPKGCFCKEGTCAAPVCSKICFKACSVEPYLMRYYCKRGSNVTVSLDKVCNGKDDCTGGHDELDCRKKEICRRHHLILLRNNLENVGKHLKGTSLGEHLITWKTKVISTIKVAERDSRPKPKVIKNIIKDILSDLLVAYGSFENYRKTSTDYALPEFVTISQIIIDSLKSCGK